jgi:anti-sigma B factor antagonist
MTGAVDHRQAGPLSIHPRRLQDVGVLTIAGEVDLCTEGLLREAADDLVEQGCRELIIDCEDVSYLDSSGIRALVQIHQTLHERHGSLTIRRVDAHLRRLFDITGLTNMMIITDLAPR